MKSINLKVILASLWLLFTFTLAAWWMRLGLIYISQQHKMIFYEGIALLVSLAAGGIALIYLIFLEQKRNKRQTEFSAAFNHELKTFMASLRLRAEGLVEDLSGNPEICEDAKKIVEDTLRLELQIENSLFLSGRGNIQLYIEPVPLQEFIEQILPHLDIQVTGELVVNADRRALEVIIKNIVQNALTHGEAKSIFIQLDSTQRMMSIKTDAKAFNGDLGRLGELFYRHTPRSRSGIGLYLVKTLSLKMGSLAEFTIGNRGELITTIIFNKDDL